MGLPKIWIDNANSNTDIVWRVCKCLLEQVFCVCQAFAYNVGQCMLIARSSKRSGAGSWRPVTVK